VLKSYGLFSFLTNIKNMKTILMPHDNLSNLYHCLNKSVVFDIEMFLGKVMGRGV